MSGADSGWASPGGGAPDEPPRWGERTPPPDEPVAAPPAGPYGSPGPYAAPGPSGSPAPYGSPGATGYGAPAGQQWTPPPKPGLVPLHPLGFGQLLGIAFATIRWNPRATVLPAVLINIVQVAVLYGLGLLVAIPGIDRIARADDADRPAVIAGVVALGAGVVLLSLALGVIGTAVLQAIVITVVARGTLGEKPGPGAAIRRALQSFWPLAAFTLLVGAVEFVVIALLAGVVTAVALTGPVGIAVAVLVGIIGLLGLVVLIAWLTVKLGTVPSAIVMERLGMIAAMRRSWLLLRGSFWRTFGLVILVGLIVGAAAQVVAFPINILGTVVSGLLAPNMNANDPQQAVVVGLISGLPAALVGVIAGGIGQIAQVASFALVYVDQRMRREGLDIELQRAVETGDTADPFARRS